MSANTEGATFVITQLKEFSAKKVAKLMLAITDILIRNTPVDTGWARSNWVPSIGRAFDGVANDPSRVSTAEQESGSLEVAGYLDFAWGDLFITNNVPYILPLNEGHSAQAPAGFVQAAIEQGIASVQ